MTKKKDIENLGFLGNDAQKKIVKALIEDKDFFLSVVSGLDPNVFTGDNGVMLRSIAGIAKDFYNAKGICASYNDIETLLLDKARTTIEMEEAKGMIASLKSEDLVDGMQTNKEIALKFFKQQETVKVLQKGLESLVKDGYVEGKTISKITEGLKSVEKSEVDESYQNPIDLFEYVMSKDLEVRVASNIEQLDAAMNGGLPKKNVGLLIAKTGAGKTTLGTIMCAGAAYLGYKVLQIFFEEDYSDIAQKHYAYYTHRYTKEFTSRADKEVVWAELKKDENIFNAMKNNTRLKRMPNGTTQVEDIKNAIMHFISQGWKPDMVFIDYFSCLQKSSDRRNDYNNECAAGEKAMKKLEQMAFDLDIAVWVAEQTNRNALQKNTAFERMGNIQGSYRVTQPASFILYLDRGEDRTDYNSANLYMDKCRGCSPCKWTNIYLNNGNLTYDFGKADENKSLDWEDDEKY